LPRRILLADDSVTAQNMGRKILTDAGYEVITVNNGSAALKKIGEAKPDLVVLDVYMPGYSGLEVCFRVKEARETADIPVLLTVGKLEPFKHDEARRARADAFIIKPFEASELLAALNKLEANQSSGAKAHSPAESPSQPVKDMATFERYAKESGPRYGDHESGWKARLKFPSATPKSDEPIEPEPAPVQAVNSFRNAEAGEIRQPDSASPPSPPVMERPIPAGIPQDITPEEIAALSAAAARVGMGFNGKQFEPLVTTATPTAPPVPEPGEESATETTSEAHHISGERVESPVPMEATAPEALVPAPHAVAKGASASAEANASPPASDTPAPSVQAAAPAPASDSPQTQATGTQEELSEPVTAAAAVAPQATAAAGSGRWVAEEIPLDAAEAALVLEKEMHKAFAAFAAAEYKASAYEPAPVDREDEPMFATMAPPAIGSPVPFVESAGADREPKETPAAASMAASAAAGAASLTHVETQPVVEPPKPPAPFVPLPSTLDEEKHAVAAFGEPQPFGASEPVSLSEAEPSAVAESKTAEPTSEQVKHVAAALDPEARRDAQMAAETAAAWANWRDIRDTVVGDKPEASAPAEDSPAAPPVKPAGGFEDFTAIPSPVEPATPEPEEAADDAEAVSADSLSNIVDGMLADLKPKLMAELAKKLDKEKKDKKKKK
jgi:twitching motility two-component system response regulator PilH